MEVPQMQVHFFLTPSRLLMKMFHVEHLIILCKDVLYVHK
jgi:hypothetical protein